LIEKYNKVLVVGTGIMGTGIAQVCALAGLRVELLDAQPAAVERAMHSLRQALAVDVERGRVPAAAAEVAIQSIQAASPVAPIGPDTIVVEAIREDLLQKQTLFQALEERADPATILATNTSSLSVTAIASACRRPERIAGWHFFNPVPRMRLAEVINGVRTDTEVVKVLSDVTRQLGFRPVLAEDSPGFVVNHAGRAFVTEALQILEEGVAVPATVDAILRETAGFRMGPFELLDLTGLDVSHPVMESIYRQFYEDGRYRPSPIARTRFQAGLLGRKSGAGFYKYQQAPVATIGATRAEACPKPDSARIFFGASSGFVPEEIRAKILAVEGVSAADVPQHADFCLVAPIGSDLAAAVDREEFPPGTTIAVDGVFFSEKCVTLMASAATSPAAKALAERIFSAAGFSCHWIQDSVGFVAQRVVGMLIHLACEIAQKGIAAPADIDAAVRIALGYPKGPFEWGNALGPATLLALQKSMFELTGDSRYRPSQWLRRRVQLGLQLDTAAALH